MCFSLNRSFPSGAYPLPDVLQQIKSKTYSIIDEKKLSEHDAAKIRRTIQRRVKSHFGVKKLSDIRNKHEAYYFIKELRI
jgi:hypothetical protein